MPLRISPYPSAMVLVCAVACLPVWSAMPGEPSGEAAGAADDSLGKRLPWQNPVPAKTVEEILSDENAVPAPDTPVSVETKAKSHAREELERLARSGPGKPSGLALSATDGGPVPKARVVLQGPGGEFSVETDDYGLFQFGRLPPGDYLLKAYGKGFSPHEKKVRIDAQTPALWEVVLEPRILKGQLIEVKAPAKAGSELDLLQRRQQATGVMEGVGAEQISKSTDSDAGAIAKRLTGTSVVGGKYVFVRGLGERYANMTLNGLPVPTPEKDKRVVPQDLFPASALQTFAVYKTFSADLPADFAGGSLDLETKGFPEKDFLKVSLSAGATDYLGDGPFLDLGDNRLAYPGGGAVPEFLGFGDAYRERPDVPFSITSATFTREERAEFARRFHNRLAVDTAAVWPAGGLSLSAGQVLRLDEDRRTGYLLNLGFKNGYAQKERERIHPEAEALTRREAWLNADGDPRLGPAGDTLFRTMRVFDTIPGGQALQLETVVPGLTQTRREGTYETTLSGLLNWGYEDYDHKLWFKSLYASLSEDRAFYNRSLKVPGVSSGQDNALEERFVLDFERRSILIGQLGGGHYLGLSVLDSARWAAGLARAFGTIPDSKKYAYVRLEPESPVLQYDFKQPWGTREWEELHETGGAGRVDVYLVIPPSISRKDLFRKNAAFLSDIELPKGCLGGLLNVKSRAFDAVRYDWSGLSELRDSTTDYRLAERQHDPDFVAAQILERGTGLQTTPKDYDTYTALEGSFSSYMQLSHGLKILGVPAGLQLGGRYEYYFLDFTAPFTGFQVVANPELRDERAIEVDRRDHLFYPAAGLDVEFLPGTKTRLVYSQTQVRPEFRERAPVVFFDTEDEVEVKGNPDLRDTRIEHYDLRFDWFLPFNQMFSASVFHKSFDDPVERVLDAVPSPAIRRFQNADNAYVFGLELEVDLKMGELLDSTPLASALTRGWSFYANAAWMRSRVDIDTTQEGTVELTSKNRPMMGQSPYLYNVKLTHEREFGAWSILNAALFNVFGERVHDLGAAGVPDTYEEPFPSLDYLGKVSWGRHQVDVKVKNLLNSRKVLAMYPDNHEREYHTVNAAERDVLYAGKPRRLVVDKKIEGMGFSVGYGLSF